ncbi:uroporphyrinogen-III C-methyltransferase [Roseovarius ramblicola]|uniref:uroporphyrinogen-III C-methyltransferase n=1 Tax=Roseovarius ramblicola TaxID=2022336 RepID=A0ABV5I0H9_9RHOB
MPIQPASRHVVPVALVGAGPGGADLLTIRALRLIESADVVIHDRLVSDDILTLAPAQAHVIAAGKQGFGPATPQDAINALITGHARTGARVVRLKGGDPVLFGRLEEEVAALEAAGIAYEIVPGVSAASAAAAAIGQSLTSRGRNSGIRLLTGHDMQGFADHDWRALARPGEVAALYMAKRAARYVQGRLMMHGAAPDTPVTLVENAARPDERILATTLADWPPALNEAGLTGPALTFLGLAPRAARSRISQTIQELA